MVESSPLGLDALLANYPFEMRTICLELQVLAHRIMPDAHEMIYHAALGYATSSSAFDRFIYIAPQQKYVTLGFFFGTHLPDPEHLLIGEGARMRHVKVQTVQAARDPRIEALVRAAWEDAPGSVAQLHKNKKKT